MSRDDVALLVFRVVALWLGAGNASMLVSTFSGSSVLHLDGGSVVAVVAMSAIAVILWLGAPALARGTFGGRGEPATVALTPASIPPLACFVVGLLQIASAVPQGAGWLAALLLRQWDAASVMGTATDANLYLQQRGASIVADLAIGAVLIVLSRRRDLWTTGTDAPTE